MSKIEQLREELEVKLVGEGDLTEKITYIQRKVGAIYREATTESLAVEIMLLKMLLDTCMTKYKLKDARNLLGTIAVLEKYEKQRKSPWNNIRVKVVQRQVDLQTDTQSIATDAMLLPVPLVGDN